MAEYDRRRAAREAHARAKLGAVGVAFARLSGEPQSTQAWKRGAEGEQLVAKRLAKLLGGSDVRLLHDRRHRGHGRANIDHIAIGPGGVTVIDAKNYKGAVRVDRVGGLFIPRQSRLLIDGRDRTGLVDSLKRQIDTVHGLLDAAGLGEVDVRGALCFADGRVLPLLRSQLKFDTIVLGGTKAVAQLATRPGEISAERLDQVYELLCEQLPPAATGRSPGTTV